MAGFGQQRRRRHAVVVLVESTDVLLQLGDGDEIDRARMPQRSHYAVLGLRAFAE
ncbi:hypothetical protein [Saccharothrix violaceirubra]|uniref:Uncharacterized protein n=1 Tax=Saccharothrix violaceirubra TaxID=413306 RepID=A0A7W7SYH5_9PSEU|nr:hypothetical protein [Saccharothrix violaceirubra]MBB4963224.1 hypothetical protein [Saccharothrix violaceirubra]